MAARVMSQLDGRDLDGGGSGGGGGVPGYAGDPSLAHPPRQAPTSAEIDAVIAAAIANAPPAPPPLDVGLDTAARSLTPLMTNILPSAIGADGRVNLFVGNLPYRVRWQDLKDLFRKAGTVLRADVSLGPDNRSRGYGNVLMGSREDAARAIDRFNGFTWQTRTLEVRPDRLPQEYEPQAHVHHKPMYGGGFMPPAMPHHFGPGGAGGAGGAWLGRPPHHGGPSFGAGFPPHMGPPAHGGQPAMGFGRPPPLGHGHSPGIQPLGASVLAGSLTAGGGPPGGSGSVMTNPTWGGNGRDALAPFGSTTPDTGSSSAARSASPALAGVQTDGLRPHSPGKLLDPAEALGRVPLHSNRMTPNLLPTALPTDLESTAALRRPSSSSDVTAPVLVPPPIPLNGLANQARDLGAPNTLYDRVVFVKNLSLTTQWQDLKDLFRPAGAVIRADVATGPDGQSRGFGTVLFATKDDARRAVGMLNGHEVDGRILNVQTERQTLEDKHIQPIHPVESFGAFDPSPASWTQPAVLNINASPTDSMNTPPSSGQSPGNLRVPWQLNTTLPNATKPAAGAANAAKAAKHPGPISLPPFPSPSDINPLSQLQTRNLPPMTPSMPGFVFNAHPQTPPVYAQFLSPGTGPFSPGLPVSRSTAGGKSPFINAAPGAPVSRPGQAGSAALGTPTTEVKSTSKQGSGAPGSQLAEEYFPPVDSSPEELANAAAGLSIEGSHDEEASITSSVNTTDSNGQARSWSKVAGGE